ncbi:type III secretion system export apparatus subunit SctS [Limnobacter sp.]|uniref:type III secretion system export apparatus subunit SctS n=1 Tax=Limnobacter sp. TaxID=2003368 RepID=UPI002FDF5E72
MLIYYVNQALWLSFLIAAPVVIVTMVLGLLLGFMQAVFQLQDQALPFGIKLLAVTVVLVTLGSWMAGTMVQFTQSILDLIALPRS